MILQKEPSVKVFAEKFGDAAKLYDVSIREDRFLVSEILALDSFVSQLDDIPLFANQFLTINLATLDVCPSTLSANARESITNMVLVPNNTTLPLNSSLPLSTLYNPISQPTTS